MQDKYIIEIITGLINFKKKFEYYYGLSEKLNKINKNQREEIFKLQKELEKKREYDKNNR